MLNQIQNCDKCFYDNPTSQINCVHCKELAFLTKEGIICTTKEIIEIYNDTYYINETHVGNCSDVLNNCFSCSNETFCTKCKDGYIFGKNNTECILDENINQKVDGEENNYSNNYFPFIYIFRLQIFYISFLLIL